MIKRQMAGWLGKMAKEYAARRRRSIAIRSSAGLSIS